MNTAYASAFVDGAQTEDEESAAPAAADASKSIIRPIPGPRINIGWTTARLSPGSGWSGRPGMNETPITMTLDYLSKCMAANLQTNILWIVRMISPLFRLGPTTGRRNIERMMATLKSWHSLQEDLSYGFADGGALSNSLRKDGNAIGLILCAALTECYPESVAVNVLIEMAAIRGFSGEHMPSALAWRNFLKSCAGMLAATDFPTQVEEWICRDLEYQHLGLFEPMQPPFLDEMRHCSHPRDIAECLCVLGAVSRGTMSNPIIVGGTDIGCLATLAEWLFDLEVSINDRYVGSRKFTSTYLDSENGHPQGSVTFTRTYDTNEELRSPAPSNYSDTTDREPDMVCLEKYSTTLYLDDDIDRAVSGRVKWEIMFTHTFGRDFQVLIRDHPDLLGELLGYASRILASRDNAENTHDDGSRHDLRMFDSPYSPGSTGFSLVKTILKWFPELKELKQSMERAVRYDSDTAKEQWKLKSQMLSENSCSCDCCCRCLHCWSITPSLGQDGQLTGFNENADMGSRRDDVTNSVHFCRLVLVETIIHIARLLSIVRLPQPLNPKRSGLEHIYRCQRELFIIRRNTAERQELQRTWGGPTPITKESNRDDQPAQFWLSSALTLFAGPHEQDNDMKWRSAISHKGILAYLGTMMKPNRAERTISGIYVLPGRLHFQKKTYEELLDIPTRYDTHTFDKFYMVENYWQSLHRPGSIHAIRDSHRGLEAFLVFGGEPGDKEHYGPTKTLVGPARLADTLFWIQRLVPCQWSGERYRAAGARPMSH